MNRHLTNGFTAGALGAVILMVIMYVMLLAMGQSPMFVGAAQGVVGENPMLAHVLGAIGFILAGGIWGLIFAALVSRPTVLKGILFGLLPSLFLWVVMLPLMGKPIFNGFEPQGIIMPLVFNCLVWGSFVGWYCGNRQNAVNEATA